MPSLDWNATYWGGDYAWPWGGEEWSEAWGGSVVQWQAVIAPRVARAFPARSIVEIAPGHGRWTRFLLPAAERYRGYDLAEGCVTTCRTVFAEAAAGRDVAFLINDGRTLHDEADGSVDFVFSFDSLVHAEMDVMSAYLGEIARVLRPGGRAFLHHSNLGMFGGRIEAYAHERGTTVSAESVRVAAGGAGLETLVQEMVNWKTRECIDCFSLFGKETGGPPPTIRYNDGFWENAAVIKATVAPYFTP